MALAARRIENGQFELITDIEGLEFVRARMVIVKVLCVLIMVGFMT